jgi:ATP-binding cassette subfamily G (WHITE) protein 1
MVCAVWLLHIFFDLISSETFRWSNCHTLIPTDTEDIEEDEEVTMLNGLPKKIGTVSRLVYAAPFHTQVAILLERTWRTIWREKVPLIPTEILLFISDDEIANSPVIYFWPSDPDDDASCSSYGRGFFGGISVLANWG